MNVAAEIQQISGPKLVDWKKELASNETIKNKIKAIRTEVHDFARKFRMPGVPTHKF